MMQNISINKSKLSTHYKQINNIINIHSSNSFLHEMLKCAVCKTLKDSEHCFVTEARFTSELRADVYDLTENICYEIVCSEKEKSIEIKRSEYPVREIITICASEFENVKLIDLEKVVKNKIDKYL